MHGENQAKARNLRQHKNGIRDSTKAVDDLKAKGASDLAMLAPLNGKDFEEAYVDAMVKNHTEVLAMIDNQLLKDAENEQLRKNLVATREEIASHLEQAKKLQ